MCRRCRARGRCRNHVLIGLRKTAGLASGHDSLQKRLILWKELFHSKHARRQEEGYAIKRQLVLLCLLSFLTLPAYAARAEANAVETPAFSEEEMIYHAIATLLEHWKGTRRRNRIVCAWKYCARKLSAFAFLWGTHNRPRISTAFMQNRTAWRRLWHDDVLYEHWIRRLRRRFQGWDDDGATIQFAGAYVSKTYNFDFAENIDSATNCGGRYNAVYVLLDV